ncbi:ribosome recycling factor [bacterium]|nr:ribosome recycling factor [bacterium]
MLNEIYNDAKTEMGKVITALKGELAKVRTGRANPTLLDNIKIEYYGEKTLLRQIAGIQIPEPRLIVIQPWDKTIINNIEKAILEGNIGVTPQNDGVVIRLPFPPLSEETRRESLKITKQTTEKYKVGVRNVRHDEIEMIKQMEKDKDITEDERGKGIKEIDKITGEFISKIDETLKEKEKEILSI